MQFLATFLTQLAFSVGRRPVRRSADAYTIHSYRRTADGGYVESVRTIPGR